MMKYKLRLSGLHHKKLREHLFPGDGREAVALALCGVTQFTELTLVTVNDVFTIPYESCSFRSATRVTWPTELLVPLLEKSNNNKRSQLVIFKIHSHFSKNDTFSELDDEADDDLFPSIAGWLDTDFPGISAIMWPDGQILARAHNHLDTYTQVDTVMVAGPDIKLWPYNSNINEIDHERNFMMRTEQTFGKGTVKTMSGLSIGVVGVSGTGSPVAEMLYRLGIGELVLVDDDVIKPHNVSRIYNSTLTDADNKLAKVIMMYNAIEKTGLQTKVVPLAMSLFNPDVIRRLAQCDVIFGCMDSVDGRQLLNELCTFYCIPYFDLGVRLDADGVGGINQVNGTVHYLQPGGSSLFSRKAITQEALKTEAMKRTNPDEYDKQLEERYIKGANEDSPAVISVNTLVASLAVNDFLARIHPYRDDNNENVATLRISLNQSRIIIENEGDPCHVLQKRVGLGDVSPLLYQSFLSEGYIS